MGRKMKGSKGGKFINPTDQARKEARKRELRKNKKQRLIVRTAVLKGKDPFQIIAELERLDRMEFDYSQSSALSEKVLGDKRRKLKETWDRLVRHYIKEDKERFLELKRMEADYEARRTELMKEYQAVKSAQEVSIEDIPLPSLPVETPSSEPATDSIIKQSSLQQQVAKVPPGCPQGLPPTLGEFEGTDDDVEETDDEQESGTHKRVHFSAEDALKSDKDSNLTDFLNEIEKIERLSGEKIGKENDNVAGKEAPDQSLELPPDAIAAASGQLSVGKALILPNSRLPLQPAPPVALVPPLNLQPIFPPASVRPSTLSKFGGAPRLSVPQLGHGLPHMIPTLRPNAINANVRGISNATSKSYTFLPSNSTSPFTNLIKNSDDRKPQGTTISAKPQLRNLSADSTRFMPLSLRLKRDERPGVTSKRTPQSLVGYGMISHTSSTLGTSSSSLNTKEQKNSKDDAYVDFMKEMSGFM